MDLTLSLYRALRACGRCQAPIPQFATRSVAP